MRDKRFEELLGYTLYEVKQGVGGLVYGPQGIIKHILPTENEAQVRNSILAEFPEAKWYSQAYSQLKALLFRYFRAQRTQFGDNVKIDISRLTPFQQKVLFACRNIGYGETRSYQWLAERVGRMGAARAVGQSLKRNSLPLIIPCHRVIRADWELGGWSGPLGWKEKLLGLENLSLRSIAK